VGEKENRSIYPILPINIKKSLQISTGNLKQAISKSNDYNDPYPGIS